MVATLVLPSLELSKDVVDFGTCLVGQTREIQITLTNCTTSDSQWSCTEGNNTHTHSYKRSYYPISLSKMVD